MKDKQLWLDGKITVTKRADDWHACLTGESEYWDAGQTAAEAVGNLLRTHSERFLVLPK